MCQACPAATTLSARPSNLETPETLTVMRDVDPGGSLVVTELSMLYPLNYYAWGGVVLHRALGGGILIPAFTSFYTLLCQISLTCFCTLTLGVRPVAQLRYTLLR